MKYVQTHNGRDDANTSWRRAQMRATLRRAFACSQDDEGPDDSDTDRFGALLARLEAGARSRG